MATQRAEIGLADWIRVLEQLPATTTSERSQIFRFLGLQVDAGSVDIPTYHSKSGAWSRKRPGSETAPKKLVHNDSHQPENSSTPESPIDLPDEILPIRIEKLPNALEAGLAPPLPVGIENQIPLNLGESGIAPVPRISLFPPRTARGVLNAAVAQPVQSFDLDIPRLIRASVQRQPLRKLPLLPHLSSRNGCQLLLDFSDALIPWWDDMRDLMQQFHAVLGETACPVYEFTHDPRDAIRWTEAGEMAWKNEMVVGRPVVIATDFGQTRSPYLGLRPSLSVWRDFALYCRRQQIPVIALNPLEREHFPKTLEHLMPIIEWRPQTRASDVKLLINRKQGIRP